MKICTKCNIEKELSEFGKQKAGKYGVDSRCKICVKEYSKLRYSHLDIKEKISLYNKERNIKNKNKSKQYYQDNKICMLEYSKQYELDNKEKVIEYHKNYQQVNKEKIQQQKQEYISKNRDKILTYAKEYRENNKEKTQTQIKQWIKTQTKTNPEFKLKERLRNRLYVAITKQKTTKSQSTLDLLGCSIQECRQHLELQFRNGMSWSNHGIVWEIDHIKPCSKFDLSNIEEQKQCFHYTNLQPLFKTTTIAEELGYNEVGNRNKSNK